MDKIRVGDVFEVILRKSNRSKTLGGEEAAGRKVGYFAGQSFGFFTAKYVSPTFVETEDRQFQFADFHIRRL